MWEAPDLLDEFKEFLPDPAAQAYGVAADAESGCGVMSGVPPTVAGSQRNPTVGSIPPPLSVSKRQGKEREGPVALQPLDFKVERGDGVVQAVNEVGTLTPVLFRRFLTQRSRTKQRIPILLSSRLWLRLQRCHRPSMRRWLPRQQSLLPMNSLSLME